MGRSTLPRNAKQLRAFLYQRASVDPLKRATSTAAQHVENVRVCEFNNWEIAGSYTDDGLSASRHAKRSRKGWDDMVAAVDRGEADIIVAWEDSRAYRDLEVYLKLRKLCEKTGVLL
jgi:DNA invertase Pin-like site-specific DNA recombinase